MNRSPALGVIFAMLLLQPGWGLAQTPMTKCVGNGRTVYTQAGPCPPGLAPVQMQLQPLSAADAQPVPARRGRAALAAAPTTAGEPERVSESRRKRANRCEALARQIEQIDALARQPQSGARQDALREQRRRVQRRHADLGC